MDLIIKNEYTNKEIAEIFKCSNQGGIRKSKKTNTVVVFAKYNNCSYKHKKDGDTTYFCGMGKKGNQELKRQNKSLYEAEKDGFSIHLFEMYEEGIFIYEGEVTVNREIGSDTQVDDQGDEREVLIFKLEKSTK